MVEETSNWMGDQPNGKKIKMQQIVIKVTSPIEKKKKKKKKKIAADSNQLLVHQLDNQSYTSTKDFIQIVNRYLITTVNIVISSKWKKKKTLENIKEPKKKKIPKLHKSYYNESVK